MGPGLGADPGGPGKTTRRWEPRPQPPPYWACLLTFQKGAPNASRGLHDPTSLKLRDRACAGRKAEGCACAGRAPWARRVRLRGVCVCVRKGSGFPSLAESARLSDTRQPRPDRSRAALKLSGDLAGVSPPHRGFRAQVSAAVACPRRVRSSSLRSAR